MELDCLNIWKNSGASKQPFLYWTEYNTVFPCAYCQEVSYFSVFHHELLNQWSTISHINYWDQVNSWKNLWKLWNGPFCRNKSGPSSLLNVTGYWKNSNTKAWFKKLSQILANNIYHGGEGDWSQNLCEVLSKKINEK